MNTRELCEELIRCESENEVAGVLNKHNLLDSSYWKPYGRNNNNWSIINNQQADSTNALLENLVNCADANLLAKCKINGINPEDQSKAPQSIKAALRDFYNIDKLSDLKSSSLVLILLMLPLKVLISPL